MRTQWQGFVILLLMLEFHGTSGQLVEGSGLMWTAIGHGKSDLLFIAGDGHSIYVNTTRTKTVSARVLLSEAESRKVGLAMDYEDNFVFWTDIERKSIFKASLQTGSVWKIYDGISNSVEGIAVDWVAKKVYWTDASYNWIVVSDYNRDNIRTLIYTGLDKPRGITVDPIHGHLYWCDLGSTGKIEKSNLNGEGRQTILSESSNIGKIQQPNGLEIDYYENRLYWTDSSLHKVMSVDLDGSFQTVREVVEERAFVFPFDISLDQKYFFIADHSTEELWIIDRANPVNRTELTFPQYKPLGITYYSGWRQPQLSSPCSTNNGGCQHLCVGDPGGHKCLCINGFVLAADGFSCVTNTHLVPGHQVLFANDDSICRLPVDFAHSRPDITEHCFVDGVHVGAMDYLYSQDLLYFHDMYHGIIRRALLRDDPNIQDIVPKVRSISGISVDWVANNLYWTDSEMKAIFVSKLDGSFKTVLVSENVSVPHGINVYPSKQLYWVDVGLNSIESISTNGEKRKLISFTSTPVFGLTLFQDHLYWTEPHHLVDFSHASNKLVARKRLDSFPTAVLAFDKSKQTLTPGPCDIGNGGCDEICAPSFSGAECLCSQAENLFHRTDVTNDDFLLVADVETGTLNGKIYHINLRSPTFKYTSLPLTNIANPVALDYDHVEAKVYWTDRYLKTINRASLDGSDHEVIASLDIHVPDGIAIDVKGRKLYWTDTGIDQITGANLNGSNRQPIVFTDLQEPRAIIVDNWKSHIFWSDWGAEPKIERVNQDGSGRVAVVSTDLGWPNGLALDENGRKLFWCDAKTDRIEYINLKTSKRQVLIAFASPDAQPFGLTLTDRYIYWTDWDKRQVQRADKHTGYKVSRVSCLKLERPKGIYVLALPKTTGKESQLVTEEDATSTAKADRNINTISPESFIGVVVGIAVLIIATILVTILSLYCRRHHKVCFAGSSNQCSAYVGDMGLPSAPPAPTSPNQRVVPGEEATYSTIDEELSLPKQTTGNQYETDEQQIHDYVPMRSL
ncbi:low-density lipoprotein receptor-related protein 4-like isoform X2 [Ptychodera flava]|uniref:low-density lipoprotein receptor-related protein 4-like isoform X2 n=1 Tax=Ptychodera flava TaxID=63121 RepID=UPI00396A920C